MDFEDLTKQFVKDVMVRSDHQDVDINEDICWLSLTYGWAIAKGLSPDAAMTFAIHIRYHTDLC